MTRIPTAAAAVVIMMTAVAWASDTEFGNALWDVLTAFWNFVVVFEEAAWNAGFPLRGLAIGAVVLPVLFGLNCGVEAKLRGRNGAPFVFLGAATAFFVIVSFPWMVVLTYIHAWTFVAGRWQ